MKKAETRKKGHRGPSKRSLKEIPEVDFSKVRARPNPYAERIAKEGLWVQVGRGRPRQLLAPGRTTPRSVRFPERIWALLEKRAKARGLTLHAALREAILKWAQKGVA
jgi:hypothetical protein